MVAPARVSPLFGVFGYRVGPHERIRFTDIFPFGNGGDSRRKKHKAFCANE